MFFNLWGSSGSGKSACLPVLAELEPDLEIHDCDELGVPEHPTRAWRYEMTEEWIARAVSARRDGRGFLLAGEVPLGEVLSAPSAIQLDGVASCLLDCDDETRRRRLHGRVDADSLPEDELVDWGRWMRGHAIDSQFELDLVAHQWPSGVTRWTGWPKGDLRWEVEVIDTTSLGIDEVAGALSNWVSLARSRQEAGLLPLSGTWWE